MDVACSVNLLSFYVKNVLQQLQCKFLQKDVFWTLNQLGDLWKRKKYYFLKYFFKSFTANFI